MAFTTQELWDMMYLYGETGGNGRAVERLYAERFPNRRRPSYQVIMDTVFRLRERGTLHPRYEGRGAERIRRVLRAEEQLLEMVDANPGVSTRTAAMQVGVSRSTVHRILRENLLHPYHLQRVQALAPQDRPARVRFCTWFRHKQARDVDFCASILFTDECCFTRNGVLNFHNTHHWSDANPHVIQQSRFQHRFSVNVWAGIVGDRLLGPHVLPARLTGASYLDFLQNVLPEYLDDVPLQLLWFMHDGAPPHIFLAVRNFLNVSYPRWIGRGGHRPWPARSPDLNPLDFFLWGYMKTLVYDGNEIDSEEDLRQRIFTAARRIREEPGTFQRVRENLHRRIDACLRSQGGHIEHLL